MIDVIDREPTRPGRILITPEGGGAPYYATVTRADEPSVIGTPLNKTLFDSIRGDLQRSYMLDTPANELTAGMDLNTLTTFGQWVSPGSSVSTALTNTPSSEAFRLTVQELVSSGTICQNVLTVEGEEFFRIYLAASGKWGAWQVTGGNDGKWARVLSSCSVNYNGFYVNYGEIYYPLKNPIDLIKYPVVEFEFTGYGAYGSSAYTIVSICNASGGILGMMQINGANYAAFRNSKCCLNGMSGAYNYSVESEDWNASIQNSIPYTNVLVGTMPQATSGARVATQLKISTTGNLQFYGYLIKYCILA